MRGRPCFDSEVGGSGLKADDRAHASRRRASEPTGEQPFFCRTVLAQQHDLIGLREQSAQMSGTLLS